MNTNIGITDTDRQALADELSKILADEYVLYTKTRNAHWNVEGPDFYDKHIFFEMQFEQLDDVIDSIAERIRSLGHFAPATLSAFLKLTRLSEPGNDKNDSSSFAALLLSDHEQIIRGLRENIVRFTDDFYDLGTSDFITGLMRDHEKMAWFLRAQL